MKILVIIPFLLLLSGCKISSEIANKSDAVHLEVANKPDSVRVEPNSVGHVEPGAVVVEKQAVHVEKDAIHVEKGAFGHVEPGAFKVEPGAISVQGTMQQGAIQLPMTVQTGAVQMPLTTNVNEGAMKLNVSLNIAEGAIVVKGAEAGAIQTMIETPWWAYVIMGVLGIGWLITKFRKHKVESRSRALDKPVVQEASFWDVLF